MKLIHLTKNDFLQGEKSPLGTIIPEFVGQIYVTNDGAIYLAANLDKQDWIQIQPLIDLSEIGGDVSDLTAILNSAVKDIELLKPYVDKVDTNTNDINTLKLTVNDGQCTVNDVHQIIGQTVSLKDYYHKEEVDSLILTYEVLCNDLLKRVSSLEATDKVNCVRISVPNDMKLTTMHPKVLPVTASPSNHTDIVYYSSSDETVVTVNRGLLTPVSNGKATISVSCNNSKADCTVTVNIPTEEVEEKEVLSTSSDLVAVEGYITVPFISELTNNSKLKYLVWDLCQHDTVLSIGTYKEGSSMPSVLFNCNHLNTGTYEGVKLRLKRYNPITNEFEILAVSNEITCLI